MPNNIKHAHAINEKAGNSFWRDAIAKEMLNVGIAFEVLPTERRAPVGWRRLQDT